MKIREGDIIFRRGAIPNRIQGWVNYTVTSATENTISIQCDDGVVRSYPKGKWEVIRHVWKEHVVWVAIVTHRILNPRNFKCISMQQRIS